MKPNPSQYNGTLKNSICPYCNKEINNLSALAQDTHFAWCKARHEGQTKLF